MHTQQSKSAQTQNKAAANELSSQKDNEMGIKIVDNRPEAIAQRELQELANNSKQVKQLQVIQQMTNKNSSLAENVNEPTIQLLRWKWLGNNNWELVDKPTNQQKKEGLDRSPPGFRAGNNRVGHIWNTEGPGGDENWEVPSDNSTTSNIEQERVRVNNDEYLGGGANEFHIHQLGNSFHLKIGHNPIKIVTKGKLSKENLEIALDRLKRFKGDQEEWAAYIKRLIFALIEKHVRESDDDDDDDGNSSKNNDTSSNDDNNGGTGRGGGGSGAAAAAASSK